MLWMSQAYLGGVYMQGRTENILKSEQYLLKKIEDKPCILKDYMSSFSNKTHTTKRSYVISVIKFFEYLTAEDIDVYNTEDLKQISRQDICDYMEHIRYKKTENGVKELSESYRAAQLYGLIHFFDFMKKDDYISSNPCKEVDVPKINQLIDVVSLTPKEIQMLENNVSTGVGSHAARARQEKWRNRDKLIITLALVTGMRVSALSEVNIEDINMDNRTIIITEKGNVTRPCKFGQKVASIMKKWLSDRKKLLDGQDVDALFISTQRRRMTPRSIDYLIRKYSVGIDKKVSPHKLRSTCGNSLYKETRDIYLVQSVLGHSNIKNTRRYAQVDDDIREEAVSYMESLL